MNGGVLNTVHVSRPNHTSEFKSVEPFPIGNSSVYRIQQNKCVKMLVLSVVAPCSMVEVYRRFRGGRPGDGGSKHL
jgi:hypothetical protein